MGYGVCKLTGQSGKLVKSHLIPKAFTKSPVPGEPRVEAGIGERPKRRFDSWYDSSLVTRAGEDILADLDNFAVREFRRLQLTWESFAQAGALPDTEYDRIEGTNWGFREVACYDVLRLRLFFLSLLWRAAVSEHVAFAHISIENDRIELLRSMILSGDARQAHIYPIVLTQITTVGDWHVASPSVEWKTHEGDVDGKDSAVKFYRFFLNGLIVHMDDETTDPLGSKRWDKLQVGGDANLHLLTQPFEGSRQADELAFRMADVERDHASDVAKILGSR